MSRFVSSRLTGWRRPLALVLFVFPTSWLAMWLVEPPGNQITQPENYWWYFVVTSATVGYGDFFPESTGGHIVGAYVILGGIVTLTLLFTELANYIQSIRGKRMRGTIQLDLTDHVVLLGYTPGRTEKLVSELLIERRLRLVLCAWDEVTENPLPEEAAVQFVRGDLTTIDVMTRACVSRARTAVIDGRDDNETLAIAVAVDHQKPDIHLIAAVRDLERREQLGYVNPRVHCVQWHMPALLAEEVTEPGITEVYNDLMSAGGHGNTYALTVPKGFPHATFGDLQVHVGRAFAATLIAVRTNDELVVTPPWHQPLDEGTVVYYLSRERIDFPRFAAQ
jgi:voltage-gated potassium channel